MTDARTTRGLDVSAYQGVQDWAAHKSEGVSFAFAKASEGQSTHDPRFGTHIEGIKAAGLVPGAYHFAWPNQDAAKEAANYIAAVKPHVVKGFTHWLDLERYTNGRNYAGRTDSQIKTYAAAWIAAVQHAFPGQRVGVYTSSDDLAKGHVPAGTPLWYPAYPWGAAPYSKAETAAKPHPSGWSPLIWQFTSTPLDRSICYLSEADLRVWAGGVITPPKPKVVPKPTPVYAPFPGAAFFKAGRKSPLIAAMHKRLVAEGCNKYRSSTGTDVWGSGDVASYAAFQRKLGYSGKAADGVPGKLSWAKLKVPKS